MCAHTQLILWKVFAMKLKAFLQRSNAVAVDSFPLRLFEHIKQKVRKGSRKFAKLNILKLCRNSLIAFQIVLKTLYAWLMLSSNREWFLKMISGWFLYEPWPPPIVVPTIQYYYTVWWHIWGQLVVKQYTSWLLVRIITHLPFYNIIFFSLF